MPKLFMLLVGCTPTGRNIEQHDVFFGIAETVNDLVPNILSFWPGANKLHLDAWREITNVNGYKIVIVSRDENIHDNTVKLFFLNLGGYKQSEFEEFHYKLIVAAPGKGEAINQAKQTAFFQHTGFEGAVAHVDDKYGVDVDDAHEIVDILSLATKERYRIVVNGPQDGLVEDELHLGYIKLSRLQEGISIS